MATGGQFRQFKALPLTELGKHIMKITGRIFIAGTSRSGTTVIADLLDSHPHVCRIGDETRFIVDPGGLRELYDVLTTRYDFYRASDAFHRFDKLIRLHLTGRTDSIHRGFRLDRVFGEDVYFKLIHKFIKQLTLLEFDEILFPETGFKGQFEYGPSQAKRARRVVPRFFSKPDELLALCRELVDGLFSSFMEKSGKSIWCEKTPFNLFNMDFLWKLFPNAVIIHTKRDPRGVVVSMENQPWAPSGFDAVTELLLPIYESWFQIKSGLDLDNRRYYEVKIEDFANDQSKFELELEKVCGISETTLPELLKPGRPDWWQKILKGDDLKNVNDKLGSFINKMGYTI